MPDDKVTSLREFVERVRRFRQCGMPPQTKSYGFAAKARNTRNPFFAPSFYRPPEKRRMKPIPELLEIEYELYEEFTRCGVQLCDTKPEEGYQEWD